MRACCAATGGIATAPVGDRPGPHAVTTTSRLPAPASHNPRTSRSMIMFFPLRALTLCGSPPSVRRQGCVERAAAVEPALRDHRPGGLERVEPDIKGVAVIAAATAAAATTLDPIIVRHDLREDLRAGGQVDIA